MFKKKNSFNTFIYIVSSLYFTILFYLLFFSQYRQRVQGTLDYNLVPFRSISRDVDAIDGIHIGLLTNNLFGNILAFVPFGLLVPLIWRKINNWKHLFLFSILTTLSVEILQLLFKVGVFDIDDMILNVIGSMIGFLFLKVVPFQKKH
ncbi:glycopeptide antibiotics resistance protein [Peribacillus deserti]|uniref:Glycopeptide antibiotics resistance protein n=1 Tax=Peribacillus deserti TaxID=673318 RepID=A0ABS2QKA3_9BACI|nr:VanZ family protein [Peribacillus deserti]MBM7692711.1 glycopeptide antibiotics resistance protein [Peribacillus deserti]